MNHYRLVAGLTDEDYAEFFGGSDVFDEAAAQASLLADLDTIQVSTPEENSSIDGAAVDQIGPSGPDSNRDVSIASSVGASTAKALASGVSNVSKTAKLGDTSHLPASIPSLPEGYASFADGIYEFPADDAADPVFICGPLRVHARFADRQGRGSGNLVSVMSSRGTWHDIPVRSADLQRRPGEVVATLVDHGLNLSHEKQAKDRLIRFLKLSRPDTLLETVDRMGWCDDENRGFVAGETLIGRQDVLPVIPAAVSDPSVAGDADTWKREIGARCRRNPMMILATSLAFSGPLLAPLGVSGGGLHFRGASSSGKTTLLNAAASVWGGRRLITQWRATSNGLEAVASRLNDMLLPLDEIAEISPRDLHQSIYMLANGTGKARMSRTVALASQHRWRLALISSGEISVQEKLAEARLEAMAGHEVRLIDIEADSRAHGVFDELHGAPSAATFSDGIRSAADKAHGAVGRHFVERLISSGLMQQSARLTRIVLDQASSLCAKLPGAADGQILRVAQRFAVIGLAGELATAFGLTGWDQHDARTAAEQAFIDWYDRRYSVKREAVSSFAIPLQRFLAANLNLLVMTDGALAPDDDPAGWRDASRAYLPSSTWSRLFPGADGTRAAKALLDLQMLSPGDGGRLTRKAPRSIPGRPRLYTVNVDRVMAYRPE